MPAKQRIFDFLKSRNASMPCPLCGHAHWHGWDERVWLPRGGEQESLRSALEAIPLTCANCGFIRMQSAHVLQDPRGDVPEEPPD